IAEDVWAVNGTPADCVYLSMNGLFDFEFDLVVSGINSGANLGAQLRQNMVNGVELEDGPAKFESFSEIGGEGINRWYQVVVKEG
ncbi:5'/3'-nucleotidase SurE, partial [Acinetobacter baumannii]|nr:5'/3'-nucleotidase SurE [Acinetobacter baumannii]